MWLYAQVSAVSRTPFRSTDGLPPVSIVRQQSSPLRVLLHNMMHSSDNLYAECILSALGAKVRNSFDLTPPGG